MTTKYEPSSIDNFRKFISYKFKDPDEVSVIFDVGSLHCLESIELSKVYKNARIFAFEANPDSYQVCLENTKDYDNIICIIRSLIFLQLIITNSFIIAGNVRHWNDHYQPPNYERPKCSRNK